MGWSLYTLCLPCENTKCNAIFLCAKCDHPIYSTVEVSVSYDKAPKLKSLPLNRHDEAVGNFLNIETTTNRRSYVDE